MVAMAIEAEWGLMSAGDGESVMPSQEAERIARGNAIKRRRLAFGIHSLEEFAAAVGMSRGAVTRAEKGEASERTYEILEVWLDNFSHETSSEAEVAAKAAAEVPAGEVDTHGNVTFRLAGNFGVDVTVEGPVSNMAELQASVAALLKQMQNNGD